MGMVGGTRGKEGEEIKMIAIDWLFFGSAAGIVGAAIIDKVSEEYGFGWLGRVLRFGMQVASIGAGLYLIDIIAEVFL
nr:hypothetical protein [Paenibacillus bovis]